MVFLSRHVKGYFHRTKYITCGYSIVKFSQDKKQISIYINPMDRKIIFITEEEAKKHRESCALTAFDFTLGFSAIDDNKAKRQRAESRKKEEARLAGNRNIPLLPGNTGISHPGEI